MTSVVPPQPETTKEVEVIRREETIETETEGKAEIPHFVPREGEFVQHQIIKAVRVTRVRATEVEEVRKGSAFKYRGDLGYYIEPTIDKEAFEYYKASQQPVITEAPSTPKLVVGELSSSESSRNVRTYHDFVLLRRLLREKFPQCIIPPVPPIDYYVDSELELFLSRVIAHPVLANDSLVHEFIFSENWSIIHKDETKGVSKSFNEAVVAPVKKVYTDLTKGVKENEEERKVINIRAMLRKQANILLILMNDVAAVARTQEELARKYSQMGESLERLSVQDPTLREPLEELAKCAVEMSKAFETNANKHVDEDIASYQQFAAAAVESLDHRLKTIKEKNKSAASLCHNEQELQRLRSKQADESGVRLPFMKSTEDKIQKTERRRVRDEEKLRALMENVKIADEALPNELKRYETWKWRDFLRFWTKEINAQASCSRALTRASLEVLNKLEKLQAEEVVVIEPWWETPTGLLETEEKEERDYSITEEKVGLE